MSGGEVWHLHALAGEGALRRWTSSISARRVALIHHLLSTSRHRGYDYVPLPIASRLGATWQTVGDCQWELCQWMPGRPAACGSISDTALANAVVAVASWHKLWTPMLVGQWGEELAAAEVWQYYREGRVCPSPAAKRRVQEWQRLFPLLIESPPRAAGEARELLDRTRTIVRLLQQQMCAWLEESLAAVPLCVCLRDIHREHVLLIDDQVTGLIDFGAVGIDSPACDLARLLGSLVPEDDGHWDFAFDAYRQMASLSEREARLARLLDRTGTVISAMRWADWLCNSGRVTQPQAALERWRQLVQRAENWCNSSSCVVRRAVGSCE